jgi:hypothetical protein
VNGYNVFRLKFEGLALGMSVCEAIKCLNNSGYIETKNTDKIDELQYKILKTQSNGIPLTLVNGKNFDSSLFFIHFINNELVNYYLEKNYKTNIEFNSLRKKYERLFGQSDAFRSVDSPTKKAGSFDMLCGGKPEPEIFELIIPHVKVHCSYQRDKNSLTVNEILNIIDFNKIMAAKYFNSLEQYLRGIERVK